MRAGKECLALESQKIKELKGPKKSQLLKLELTTLLLNGEGK